MKVNKAEREMRSDNPLQSEFDDAEVAAKIGIPADKLFALRKVNSFPPFAVWHIHIFRRMHTPASPSLVTKPLYSLVNTV